jgi:protein gp37
MQKRFGIDGDPDKVMFHVERLKRLNTKRPTKFAIWNDLFHPAVTDIDIDMTLAQAALNPWNIYMVLTKRIERAAAYFSNLNLVQERVGIFAEYRSGIDRFDWTDEANPKPTWTLPLSNVWLGGTAENQDRANIIIPQLCATPAAFRFVSVEPCLSEINLNLESYCYPDSWNSFTMEETSECCLISLVIIGAETGAGRRPCKEDWVSSLVKQCQEVGVLVWIKALEIDGKVTHDLNKFPPDLRLRQFPWEFVQE